MSLCITEEAAKIAFNNKKSRMLITILVREPKKFLVLHGVNDCGWCVRLRSFRRHGKIDDTLPTATKAETAFFLRTRRFQKLCSVPSISV